MPFASPTTTVDEPGGEPGACETTPGIAQGRLNSPLYAFCDKASAPAVLVSRPGSTVTDVVAVQGRSSARCLAARRPAALSAPEQARQISARPGCDRLGLVAKDLSRSPEYIHWHQNLTHSRHRGSMGAVLDPRVALLVPPVDVRAGAGLVR
jgi:hypothetical protein